MSSPLLREKVVLVTGAARGLGRAMALACAREEAIVVGHYFTSVREARSLRVILQKLHRRSDIVHANLREPSETRVMVRTVLHRYGKIDVLVNNVGNFIYKPLRTVTYDDYRDVVDTNLTATFLCSKLVLPSMQQRRSGLIVNFGCVGADRSIIRPRTHLYYIAKQSVILLTKAFADAYAKYGIRINAISPGILTSSVVKHRVPSKRFATFADIIHAFFFLLDPKSSYVNGANIEVAGGWLP